MRVLTYIRQKIFGKRSSKNGEGAAAGAGVASGHDHYFPSSSELYGEESSDDYTDYEEQGPDITGRGVAAILSSRRLSFSGHLDSDSISNRGGDARLSFRRLSFSGESEYESEAEPDSELESAGSFLIDSSRDGNSSHGGSRRLSFSGPLIDSSRDRILPRNSQKLSLSSKLESPEPGPAIGSSKGELAGRSSRRVSFSGQLQTELGQQPVVSKRGGRKGGGGGGGHESAVNSTLRSCMRGHPQQQEKGAAMIGKGGIGSMSFSRFSFRKQSRQQDLGPSSDSSITNRAGIAGWSSRHLSLARFAKRAEEHGRGRRPSVTSKKEAWGSGGRRSSNARQLVSGRVLSKEKPQDENIDPLGGHGPSIPSRDGASGGGTFITSPVAFRKHSEKEQEDEDEDEHEHGGGPAIMTRDGASGGGSFSSGWLDSEKHPSKERREEELEQWQRGGPSITSRDEAAGGGSASSRRLSFRWLPRQKKQQEEEVPAITGREVGTARNTSSRRYSFRIGRSKQQQQQQQQQEQHEQGQGQGRSITRTGSGEAVGESSRRLSFSGLLSGGDDQDRKAGGYSKRHTQIITMWNPSSMTTVEASSEERGSKSWFRNPSKTWTELGASKRVALDPIENGPQDGSRNWRTKYFGVNPDIRWPVQGW